jgi:MFS family permease
MNPPDRQPWYAGITRYQWLVLVIASLGWIFDVFEGQIFTASMKEVMQSLAPPGATDSDRGFYTKITFAAFLIGGAVGGVLFGIISDRVGRTRAMVYTIVLYSAFTCISAFAQNWWHMAITRFFVALGTGGEWAVASAFVAEVFPKRARAWSLSIFHGSSVLGGFLASAVGAFIVGNPTLHSQENPSLAWRIGFLVGVVPSLLIIWIRLGLRDPEPAPVKADQPPPGRLSELLGAPWLFRTVLGTSLASVGLATFWGVHIYGKDLLAGAAERRLLADAAPSAGSSPLEWAEQRKKLLEPYRTDIKHAEMLGMVLVGLGGGVGLVSFGPICERLGRRGAFLLYHVGGLASALFMFRWLGNADERTVMALLPVFGCLTLGMHAGYAVYFPELFPGRLRGTGAGFCFNVGRVVAALVMAGCGLVESAWKLDLPTIVSAVSLLYLVGMALLIIAPETKGQELPA